MFLELLCHRKSIRKSMKVPCSLPSRALGANICQWFLFLPNLFDWVVFFSCIRQKRPESFVVSIEGYTVCHMHPYALYICSRFRVPPHPPCHGHGHNINPLPLWNGWVLGRGGGHPANSNATGRIRWRKLISSKRSMYAEISYMLKSDIES